MNHGAKYCDMQSQIILGRRMEIIKAVNRSILNLVQHNKYFPGKNACVFVYNFFFQVCNPNKKITVTGTKHGNFTGLVPQICKTSSNLIKLCEKNIQIHIPHMKITEQAQCHMLNASAVLAKFSPP